MIIFLKIIEVSVLIFCVVGIITSFLVIKTALKIKTDNKKINYSKKVINLINRINEFETDNYFMDISSEGKSKETYLKLIRDLKNIISLECK